MSKRDIRHLLVLRIEQLKISTNDLPSMTTKKVATAATSVSSTEAFPTTGLPSSWRCPRWWWLVSLAERWGRSAGLWPGWPAGGSVGQYPPEGGGSRYPAGGSGGGHVGGCPATGDPPHDIMDVGPI
jgi:hypothetical protein